jgi:hypothetical protein
LLRKNLGAVVDSLGDELLGPGKQSSTSTWERRCLGRRRLFFKSTWTRRSSWVGAHVGGDRPPLALERGDHPGSEHLGKEISLHEHLVEELPGSEV